MMDVRIRTTFVELGSVATRTAPAKKTSETSPQSRAEQIASLSSRAARSDCSHDGRGGGLNRSRPRGR